MAQKQLRVVHYENQFFGQIGGEDKAATGFVVKEGPLGPGMGLQKEFGDQAEVVATVICGDDYGQTALEEWTKEGLKLVAPYKPDIFIAGPAFAAGRYSMHCGALCKIVGKELGIPVISAMNEQVPGTEAYRKDVFICKTGASMRLMTEALGRMAKLALRLASGELNPHLLTGEALPRPEEYNYFSRNQLRNEYCEKSIAERSVEKLVAKIKGEEFETEVVPQRFEIVPPPPALKDLSKCKIALASDGGLVPKGNPDRLPTRSCLRWAFYDIDTLFDDHDVTHAGYFNDFVLEKPDRLVPYHVLLDLEAKGKIGKLHRIFFSTCGCTTVAAACAKMGEEMGAKMEEEGDVDAVILTST